MNRPRLEKHLGLALTVFLAFLVADLGIIAIRDKLLPASSAVPQRPPPPAPSRPDRYQYDLIAKRNIFNNDGIIPPPLGEGARPSQDNEPEPSQLPLVLVGTIVHVNPARSVATIEIKTSSKILSYVPKDDIESLATLERVERKKAIFRNNGNGRLEFIEIKDESTLKLGMSKKEPAIGIQQSGSTFSVKRTELNKLLDDLPTVLQQARAVPNIVPGTRDIDGFKILDIMPGSVFEKLGLQRMDIIKEVNGQPVNSPTEAMRIYNELKNSPQISLTIERGGRLESQNYRVE